MEDKKFYVETKPGINKCLVLDDSGQVIHNCVKIKYQDKLIFNGISKSEDVSLCLLSGEYRTEYKFNDIFSVPINEIIISAIDTEYWENCIIINAPPEIGLVMVEFPDIYTDLFGLPKQIILKSTPTNKIRITESKPKPSDYFKLGIDPQALNHHIIRLNMKLPTKEVLLSFLKLEIKVRVLCYTAYKNIKMKLNNQ
jgi:hypothetical protein